MSQRLLTSQGQKREESTSEWEGVEERDEGQNKKGDRVARIRAIALDLIDGDRTSSSSHSLFPAPSAYPDFDSGSTAALFFPPPRHCYVNFDGCIKTDVKRMSEYGNLMRFLSSFFCFPLSVE